MTATSTSFALPLSVLLLLASSYHVRAFSVIPRQLRPFSGRFSFLTLSSTTSTITGFEFPEDAMPEKQNSNKKTANTKQEDEDEDGDSDRPGSSSVSSSKKNQKPFVSVSSLARQRRLQEELEIASLFVTGDELHELRRQVWSLREQLDEARRECQTNDNDNDNVKQQQQVHRLERAILDAQQRDAEFIYEISLERMDLAHRAGRTQEAALHQQEAMRARSALSHFQLGGLWVGKYGDHGFELINVTYSGDTLVAYKLTGQKNVAKGQVTFQVDLSPLHRSNMASPPSRTAAAGGGSSSSSPSSLEPIELGPQASGQWGARFLSRFVGQGKVAAANGSGAQWIDGQLILVGDQYFSFAWLPIGHQVFFGRPSPEMTLKLLRECRSASTYNKDTKVREHIERCWEETEHLVDELELSSSSPSVSSSSSSLASSASSSFYSIQEHSSYYHQEGCFE